MVNAAGQRTHGSASTADVCTASEQSRNDETGGAEQGDVCEKRKSGALAVLGYYFNDAGELRRIEDDGRFVFTTQEDYEQLGDVIAQELYERMIEHGTLERKYMEMDGRRRFYFATSDYDVKDTVLVLIHGSGVVKAGQWARRLIINESLRRGAQLEYIDRGISRGWGVVVLNFNERCAADDANSQSCSHVPLSHGLAELRHALPDTLSAARIFVVAHSYGGEVISEALARNGTERRVHAVALTDARFSTEANDVTVVNFHTNKNAELSRDDDNHSWQLFSGDTTHEGTSSSAIDAVFHLFEHVKPGCGGGGGAADDDEETAELLRTCEELCLRAYEDRREKQGRPT